VKSIHERGLTPSQYKEKVLSSCKNAFTAHLAMNKQYQLKYPVSQKYQADGSTTLTDGKRGFDNYHILWQGFEGEDFEITIDLGENRDFNYLGAEFLQDITSWIFMPEYVEFFVSGNGKSYSSVAKVNNSISPLETLPVIHNFDQEIPSTNARYIKVFAKSLINCPSWHIGHGGKSWLFTDEIMVQKRPLP